MATLSVEQDDIDSRDRLTKSEKVMSQPRNLPHADTLTNTPCSCESTPYFADSVLAINSASYSARDD